MPSRRAFAMAAVLATASVFVVPPAIAGAPRPLSGDAALRADAAAYAADFNVDIGEAARRLELQNDAIPRLEEALKHKEGNRFAGLYVEHEPTYRVVVLLTSGTAADIGPYVPDFRLLPLVEVRQADRTLRQLHAALARALALRSETTIAFDAEIDVRANAVELTVQAATREQAETMAGALRRAAAARNEPLPRSVVIRGRAQLSQPALDIFGGLKLTSSDGGYCTSGFSIRHNTSLWLGISTAAHCDNTLSYAGYALDFQYGNLSGSYDGQWHSRGGASFPNKIYKGNGVYLLINGKVARADQPIGAYICKSGKTTDMTCGYIKTKDYAPGYVLNAQPTFITAARSDCGNIVDGGDSGGPVWASDNAWGITSGRTIESCERLIDMASNYLEGGLNITIKTW